MAKITRSRQALAIAVCVLAGGLAAAAQGRGQAASPQPPDIAGKWTGVWSYFNPAQASTPPKEQCAKPGLRWVFGRRGTRDQETKDH